MTGKDYLHNFLLGIALCSVICVTSWMMVELWTCALYPDICRYSRFDPAKLKAVENVLSYPFKPAEINLPGPAPTQQLEKKDGAD